MVEPDANKPLRFDIFLINLDPTKGSEIKKTRPCVVISPNEINSHLSTVIIAPMTTTIREHFPTRIAVEFHGKKGQIALDQLRVIDRTRIVKRLGKIQARETREQVLRLLQIMFS